MRRETEMALKKLKAGKSGLTEAELKAFFQEVRALPDEALLAAPVKKPAARAAADPTVAAVTKTLQPIEATAAEKAKLLAAAAARNGAPAVKPHGISDAVKKLKAYLADQQIIDTANALVRELAARYRPEHKVA